MSPHVSVVKVFRGNAGARKGLTTLPGDAQRQKLTGQDTAPASRGGQPATVPLLRGFVIALLKEESRAPASQLEPGDSPERD